MIISKVLMVNIIVPQKKGFQVQDMLRYLNIDKDFCQANAIKYLCRFGKKDGRNRKRLIESCTLYCTINVK